MTVSGIKQPPQQALSLRGVCPTPFLKGAILDMHETSAADLFGQCSKEPFSLEPGPLLMESWFSHQRELLSDLDQCGVAGVGSMPAATSM